MFRLQKILILILALVSPIYVASAFSLLGPSSNNPNTDWQTPTWGYNLSGDIGGPMGIGEEYRWNSPYLTYGFDPSFLNTYGSNGVAAVEQAIAIMNALPPASQMNLNAFPLRSQLFNSVAEALAIRDVKSHVMSFLLEEMGLARSERWVWTLRHREVVANNTITNYVVIQRNYDPYTWNPSSYINGSLYTYYSIFDNQNGQPPNTFPQVEPVNPLHRANYASVAGFNQREGGFFTGLTRDDAGGLRYLFATNNFNVENLLSDVEIISTNEIPTTLVTGDLAQLVKDTWATTNTPETVLTNYPGLLLLSTNSYVAFQITTNISTYFTNYPAAPMQVFETNYVTNTGTFFNYELGNVVTHFEYTNELGVLTTNDYLYVNRPVLVRAVEIVPAEDYQPGLPSIRTNYFGTNLVDFTQYTNCTNGLCYSSAVEQGPDGMYYPYLMMETITNGEFYIIPPNLLKLTETVAGSNAFGSFALSNVWGYSFISNVLTEATAVTNVDFFAPALLTIRTNYDNPQSFGFTTNWYAFSEQARTNSPAELQAIYTNLLILRSTPILTNLITSNYVFYFTNAPFNPAGSLYVTSQVVFTTNLATNWVHAFGNVVTNTNNTSLVITQQLAVVYEPFTPAPFTPITNFSVLSSNFNNLGGHIYIVPTNLFGWDIIPGSWCGSPQVLKITNQFIYPDPSIPGTGFVLPGTEFLQSNVLEVIRYETNYCLQGYPIEFVTTNELASNVFGFRREVITYATNHTFAVRTVDLTSGTNATGLRPGVDKVHFVRVGFDSQLGTEFLRTTNYYLDTVIISNQPVNRVVRRASGRPDFIVSAGDINRAGNTPGSSVRTDTSNWENNFALNTTQGGDVPAGPGVIQPQVNMGFTTTTPFYFDFIDPQDYFLRQPQLGELRFGGSALTMAWGSFDGTTNLPVIYPVGRSITNLLNQVLTPNP